MPTTSPPPAQGVIHLTPAQIDGGLWYTSGYHLITGQFTYSIPTAASSWPGYDSNAEPYTGFVGFSTAQADQFARALAQWDAYIAPNFTRTDDTANPGTIRIGFSHQGADNEFAAYTFISNNMTSQNPLASDIWVNADVVNPATTTFAAGSFDYETLLHELGHAMGLKHSFESPAIPTQYDSARYTVMSYNEVDEYQVLFDLDRNGLATRHVPVAAATPMVLDIKAIQDLYGADPTTNTGNDSYSLPTGTDQQALLKSVYDAGGIDAIVGDNYHTNLIDLRPGAYSSIGYWSVEDQISYWIDRWASYGISADFIRSQFGPDTYTWSNNLGIAFSTTIENAWGGAASDVLIGNDVANQLSGNDGDDLLTGGGGADTLVGGSGRDVFQDTIAGLDGDTIQAMERIDTIHVTDLALDSFSFTLAPGDLYSPAQLHFSGGQVINVFPAWSRSILVASADPSGGVDFTPHIVQGARGDLNGDGFSDLLWRNVNGDLSTWHVVAGAGGVQTQQNRAYVSGVAPAWQVQGTVDMNGDGAADILWHNSQTGAIAVWRADGHGGFNQSSYVSPSVDTSWSVAGAGDFDGDGFMDIIWRNTNGNVSEWRSMADFYYSPFNVAVDRSWHIQGIGDINGDSFSDVVWRKDDGSLTIWSHDGLPDLFTTRVDPSWHVAAVDDFNGDARADILWRNDNGTISLWTAQGADFRQNSYSDPSVDNSWHIAGSGDFNHDGAADILWRNDDGTMSIWEGTHGSSFVQAAYTDSSVGTNWAVVSQHYDII